VGTVTWRARHDMALEAATGLDAGNEVEVVVY